MYMVQAKFIYKGKMDFEDKWLNFEDKLLTIYIYKKERFINDISFNNTYTRKFQGDREDSVQAWVWKIQVSCSPWLSLTDPTDGMVTFKT